MYRLSTLGMSALIFTWLTLTVVVVGAQNPGGSAEGKAMKNPVPADGGVDRRRAGALSKNCRFCHGPKGLGDGPLAPKGMHAGQPHRRDVGSRVDRRRDLQGDHRRRRSGEIKMKGVKGRIADTDIWNIVNYLRSIGPKNAVALTPRQRLRRCAPAHRSSGCSSCGSCCRGGGGLRIRRVSEPPASRGRSRRCPVRATSVFTTAHATFGGPRRTSSTAVPRPGSADRVSAQHPRQEGIACTEYCHESVTTGPVAGTPERATPA